MRKLGIAVTALVVSVSLGLPAEALTTTKSNVRTDTLACPSGTARATVTQRFHLDEAAFNPWQVDSLSATNPCPNRWLQILDTFNAHGATGVEHWNSVLNVAPSSSFTWQSQAWEFGFNEHISDGFKVLLSAQWPCPPGPYSRNYLIFGSGVLVDAKNVMTTDGCG